LTEVHLDISNELIFLLKASDCHYRHQQTRMIVIADHSKTYITSSIILS